MESKTLVYLLCWLCLLYQYVVGFLTVALKYNIHDGRQVQGKARLTSTHLMLLEMPDETNKPKISVLPLEEYLEKTRVESEIVRDTVTKTSSDTTRTFGSLTIQELRTKTSTRASDKEVTGNTDNINPATPLLFAIVAAAMSYGGWTVTNYMVAHFAVQFLESDFYPAQRAAIAARNVMVGIFMLFTGFSGAIAIGLLLLGMSLAAQKLRSGFQR